MYETTLTNANALLPAPAGWTRSGKGNLTLKMADGTRLTVYQRPDGFYG